MKNASIRYESLIQVLHTANILWRESRRFFKPYGISEAQFNILHVLGEQPHGMSQRELSDLLVVDRSNVTLLLDKMSAQGLIKRNDVPGDRRAYRVALSKEGMTLWKKVLPHYRKVIESIMSCVSEKEAGQCLLTLQEIEKNALNWTELDAKS
jgi:DNA-binding MarR family transcriptional regulator